MKWWKYKIEVCKPNLYGLWTAREELSLHAVWRNISFVHTWKLFNSHKQIKLFVKLTDSHSCAPHFMDSQAHHGVAHNRGANARMARAANLQWRQWTDDWFSSFCLCFRFDFHFGTCKWTRQHAKAQTVPIRCHRDYAWMFPIRVLPAERAFHVIHTEIRCPFLRTDLFVAYLRFLLRSAR